MEPTILNPEEKIFLEVETSELLRTNLQLKKFCEDYPSLKNNLTDKIKTQLLKVQKAVAEFKPQVSETTYKTIERLNGFQILNFLKANKTKLKREFEFLPVQGYIEKYKCLLKQSEVVVTNKNTARKIKNEVFMNAEKLKRTLLFSIKNAMNEIYKMQLQELKKRELAKLINELAERIKKFMLLMGLHPDSRTAAAMWDLSKGNWTKSTLEELEQWKYRYDNDAVLKQVIAMIGRSKSYSEFTSKMMQTMRRSDVIVYENKHKEEFSGISQGNDLSGLLPSELLSLCNAETELLFFKKYHENKLNIYEFNNSRVIEIMEEGIESRNENENKVQQGPVILCIDTSGSMTNFNRKPELVAKALCLSVILRALNEKRNVYLINFSTGIKTIEFNPNTFNVNDLLNFLRMSFCGGTDPQPALREGIRKIKTEKFEDADIVMVSDFIMNHLDNEILAEMQEVKANGTRFMSLLVSDVTEGNGIPYFDFTWLININNPNNIIQLT
jgi:uncharacterized protein with von Willebrand factor type A (vWA) domain